jgi:hypothetical protein
MCFLGTTRENRCSLEHAKRKRQVSVRGCTKSARQRFQTQVIGYLERHLTTRPHETSLEDVEMEDTEPTPPISGVQQVPPTV